MQRNDFFTKHLTILKVTEILTQFSADTPTWVYFISCNSKNSGKIQIVTYMTIYVRLERYGGPCIGQKIIRMAQDVVGK